MARKKRRKTFYNWLTNRYQLIIRNEENFAEKTTRSFNYARVIVVLFVSIALIFSASLFFGKYVLSKWYNPGYEDKQRRKDEAKLLERIDLLEKDIKQKDNYIKIVKKMILGGDDIKKVVTNTENINKIPIEKLNLDSLSDLDKKLRQEYEAVVQENNLEGVRSEEGEEHSFIAPISDVKLVESYDLKSGKSGVLLSGKSGVGIKCIEDGVILFNYRSLNEGWYIGVQHRNNMISVYKFCGELLKKKGDYVKSGEFIALSGETDYQGEKVCAGLELWFNGVTINPEKFIKF